MFYIYLDATCLAGPFDTRQDAIDSLDPIARKEWAWELPGRDLFLSLPIEAFSISRGEL